MRTVRWPVLLLLPGALGGCPPPPRYLITDVMSPRGAVADALVAVDCAAPRDGVGAAVRTDERGRAWVRVRDPRAEAARCTITVAKPGYATLEASAVNVCTTAACPPTLVLLDERAAPAEGVR